MTVVHLGFLSASRSNSLDARTLLFTYVNYSTTSTSDSRSVQTHINNSFKWRRSWSNAFMVRWRLCARAAFAESPLSVSQVNHNGDLTFTSAFSQYSPQNFPMRRMDIIAALWTDLDNRVTGSILYHEYTGGSILARATQDINTYFPGVQFTASSVFVATWYQVAYFPTTGTVSRRVERLNVKMFGTSMRLSKLTITGWFFVWLKFQQATAQAILITNGRFSFVMLNYGPIAQTTRPIQVRHWHHVKARALQLTVWFKPKHSNVASVFSGWLRHTGFRAPLLPGGIHDYQFVRPKLKVPYQEQRRCTQSMGFQNGPHIKRMRF